MTQTNEQLDFLLAKEVMGWRLGTVEAGEYVWEDENYHIYYYAKPYDNLPERMLWHPTTNIAQAMMCAEKLDPLSIEIYRPIFKGGNYSVRLVYQHPETYEATAETIEIAICLAVHEAYCVSLVSTRELTEEEQDYAMKIDMKPYEKYMKGGE